MKRASPLLLVALVAACKPVPYYAAPAPAGAVDCAARAAEDLGYVRISTADEPAVRLRQPANTPREGQQQLDPVTGRPVDVVRDAQHIPQENELRIRESRGLLRIEILSHGEGKRLREEGSNAVDHAQIILARCTAG